MRRFRAMVLALALSAVFQGCVLTKIITVPMRIGGAIISIIPVVGNPVDASIDKAADVVDDVPI